MAPGADSRIPSQFPPAFHPLSQATNQAVIATARDSDFSVALVGGYVRDALLGRFSDEKPPHDFDYAVTRGKASQLGEILAKKLEGNFVMLDEALDTCRVVLANGKQIDLAGCLGGSLEADLKRRDLTINALAWQPEQPDAIVDLSGGCKDLSEKRIRLISEQSLVDDPLRLLRVFRFSCALEFTIDELCMSAVKRHASQLSKVASERITYELFLILDTDHAGQAISAMARLGLLETIFPELTPTHKVPTNAFHHLGLFDHSVETLVQAEQGYAQLPDWSKTRLQEPLAQQITRLGATKLAGLLHDIGKPQTWVVRDDGKHTFIGHETLGAEMIEATAARLRWSRPVEKLVTNLVRWHLRPGALFHNGQPSDRAIYRFYRDAGPDIPELILLAQADFRSTCGPGLIDKRTLLENQFVELLQGFAVFIEGKKRTPPLLNGQDVMRILGIESGPAVGEILKDLDEARSLGEVENKQQAKIFVVERYKQKYSS
jgi:putative nucleotidyltransferase with HDIG domain